MSLWPEGVRVSPGLSLEGPTSPVPPAGVHGDLPSDRVPAGPPATAGRGAVVGGQPAPTGAWPDAVALYAVTGQLACSGVLVAPDVVLTAGHCGFGLDHVLVGTADLGEGGVEIGITRTEVHPEPYTSFDVAVLLLDASAPVAPRAIARDCVIDGYLGVGADVAIVGFGATDAWASEWTDQLQQAFTTVRDPACSDLDAGCNADVSPGGELIAGGDGIDSCSGDSGGPLYLQTPDGDLLLGLTSRAVVPADAPCGGGGIYVRADAVADWVEEVIGRELPRPDCVGFNHAPVPRAEAITVNRGASAMAVIEVNDPDVDQGHTFTLITPPAHGSALLDPDGAVLFLAPDTFRGRDELVVEVTDDAVPPRSGQVAIPIDIVEPVVPIRGCATKGGAGASVGTTLLAFAAFALGRRRR